MNNLYWGYAGFEFRRQALPTGKPIPVSASQLV
jgi:hypothetical protein